MSPVEWVCVGLAALGGLYWLLNALLVLRTIRRVPVLEQLRPSRPEHWPKLSLIIPACNEAGTIEPATRSRLNDGYPNLEIILIDDRSDDGTGEIIDRLAAADSRVHALHITELPEGWLGKVHALHRGVETATGDWLLFSDADVHIEPDTLSRSVAYCLERKLDLLAVLPEFWPRTFLLACVFASFVRQICLAARMWAVDDPRSTAFVGVGAYTLVRREAFERTGGFEELRLTVVDDMGLAQMLKESGARCAIVNGRRQIGLHFYGGWDEAVQGPEKSVLVSFGFSYVRLIAVMLAMVLCELSPAIALIAGVGFGTPILWGLGLAAGALALFASLSINRWLRMRMVPAMFFPIGLLASVYAVARAAVLAAWRGGHVWRGVLYPNEVLRKGNRLRFP
ncbi:MAG: glycosyltransferase family 2 protein [Planctomycetes bacterium]|nr:glycosyltransferase family 2 protein [Planctomycetota bacterium]